MRPITFLFLLFFSNKLVAQEQNLLKGQPIHTVSKPFQVKAFMGVGAGLDYGGFGVKVDLEWKANYDIYLGLGNNLNGLGYNLGLMWKPNGHQSVSPIIAVMYGYNSVSILRDLQGNDLFRKTYYGPSVGFGGRFKMGAKRINNLSLMLIYPFRSPEFYNDVKAINGTYFPVSFSLGYNFRLSF